MKKIDFKEHAYDFEVYKYNVSVTFINALTKEIYFFEMLNTIGYDREHFRQWIDIIPDILEQYDRAEKDRVAILEFIEINNALLVGYNNANYDDWILFGLMINLNLFDISKFIIHTPESSFNIWSYKGFKYHLQKYNYLIPFVTYDMMLDVLLSGHTSLKALEGALGENIVESSIPWDIDRPLTDAERLENKKYNIQDAKVTLDLFLRFNHGFKANFGLIEKFAKHPYDYFRLSKKLSKKSCWIFDAKPITRYQKFNYEAPPVVKELLNDPQLLLTYERKDGFDIEKKQLWPELKITFANLSFIFGHGGLHAAISKFEYKGRIINYDFSQFYPSMIVEFGYMSAAAGKNGLQLLENLIKERLYYKSIGSILDDSLKLNNNQLFGLKGDKFSKMWDIQKQFAICSTGQLILFALCKFIAIHAVIFNVNTDGVMFIPNSEKDELIIKQIIEYFEYRLGLKGEITYAERIIQKDVNNYLLLKKDIVDIKDWDNKEYISKNVKAKGGLLKFFNEQLHNSNFGGKMKQISNNYTILDEALAKYLISGIPMEDTILNCKDIVRFQTVYRHQNRYKEFYLDDELQTGRVWRLFNVKKGKTPYKKKLDGNKERIADTSENVIFINERVLDLDIKLVDLDYDFYFQLARKKLERFKQAEKD